jgi:hypothetical protein
LTERTRGVTIAAIPIVRRKSMRRARRVAVLLSAVVALAPAGVAAGGGNAGFACGRGFDLGPLTLEESAQLPRVQDAVVDGIYTLDDFSAVIEFIDHNGNGLVCFKDVGALNADADGWAYTYNVADDNAVAP